MKKNPHSTSEKKGLICFCKWPKETNTIAPSCKSLHCPRVGFTKSPSMSDISGAFFFFKSLKWHQLCLYVQSQLFPWTSCLGGPFSASFYPHLHCPSSGYVHTVLDCLHLQTIWGVLFLWCFPSWSSQRTSTCPSLGPYLPPVSSSVSLFLSTTVSSSTPVPSLVPTLK